MPTQSSIVNASLEMIADQVQISGSLPNFDSTPVGLAAGILYPFARDMLLRRVNPDFARITIPLTAWVVTAVAPWLYEYHYPTDCVRLRQVRPPTSGTGSLVDPFAPVPIRAAVAYDGVNIGITARVILTNQVNALGVYTSNTPAEANWDSNFADLMSRQLANPLAMAIAGRPDFAREMLEEAERYASIALENTEL